MGRDEVTMSALVRYEVEVGGIARITLDSPDTRNALSDVALYSLFHARVGMHNVPTEVGMRGRREHSRSQRFFVHHFFHPKIKS